MGNGCVHSVETKKIEIEIPLKATDIIHLKLSWGKIKPKWNEISKIAFKRWFGTYPEIWSMFSTTARNVDDLLESPSIMNHSKKFEELFEIVIYNLHKREKLVESLIEYGKFHHSFGAQQRFATTLATGLKFAVFSYLQNDHNQDDCKTQEAWDSLFSFLSGLLKLGMRKAIEEEKADGRDPKQSTSQKTIFEEFSV
ncbi:uncharacterized protein LOC130647799 [Hydractinia symbiolongicarpus]|uniref:uncharacterized protein LOC130647799 n=1 Tax=Hydractinia symbiolongicarpus TaxID=13093 RepID=UPI0025506614|nr:uncharacterized protein LOC130647799 [Hydractinia symbiolongicarpus]